MKKSIYIPMILASVVATSTAFAKDDTPQPPSPSPATKVAVNVVAILERCSGICGEGEMVNYYSPTDKCHRLPDMHDIKNSPTMDELQKQQLELNKAYFVKIGGEEQASCKNAADYSLRTSCGMYGNAIEKIQCQPYMQIKLILAKDQK